MRVHMLFLCGLKKDDNNCFNVRVFYVLLAAALVP